MLEVRITATKGEAMFKHSKIKTRKLKLNHETVRALAAHELSHAVGGGVGVSDGACWSELNFTYCRLCEPF